MRLGRKKDKDDKEKDKEKKDKKDKKEKKEKRKSLSLGRKSSSSSVATRKKRTIKAKFDIHPQAVSNLPNDHNNSILFLSWKRGAKKSNRGESKRCVWASSSTTNAYTRVDCGGI
jgi:hypothetical protein